MIFVFGHTWALPVRQRWRYSSRPESRSDGIAVFKTPDVPRGYTPYVRECVLAAAGRQAPPITPRESLRVLNTVSTAYRAAEAGKVLEVPSVTKG